MKVVIIGGTGLLGLAAAKELIKRKHKVKSISLDDFSKLVDIPDKLELVYGNYETMTDAELKAQLEGYDSLVYATGVDERYEHQGPIYEYYKEKNIIPLKRVLKIAKDLNFKSSIICGSYFTYLDRLWEQLYLYETHPYIKSRLDQSNEAFSFYDQNFSVTVLEIPYVFGIQPGRKPVWIFLVDQIRRMKCFTFYPKGGTAMITVNQVGQAIAAAVETAKGMRNIPLGYYNLSWKKMLKIFHKQMGMPKRKVITIPKWIYKFVMISYQRKYKKNNIESGLNLKALAEIMTRKAYIDNHYLKNVLKVQDDDLEKAIADSVKLSLEILDNYNQVVEIK